MLKFTEILESIETEDLFKTKMIFILVSYLWSTNKVFHYTLTTLYSCWIVIFSVYVAYNQRSIPIELTMMSLGIVFIIYEIIEIFASGFQTYQKNAWNLVDLSTYSLIIVTFALIGTENLDITHGSWLLACSLFLGYWKWIAFFRNINRTRRFMRILTEIIKDLEGFIVIVAYLIFGFSLIFYVLDSDNQSYGDSLLQVYGMLYSSFNLEQITKSQLVFFVLVTGILSVIMLNMIIAVMTESFNRVLRQRDMIESKEKILLIHEAIVMKRAFYKLTCRKRKKEHAKHQNAAEKQYIFFAQLFTNSENEKANFQKNNETSLEKERLFYDKNLCTSIIEKLEDSERDLKEMKKSQEKWKKDIESRQKTLEKKLDTILELMTGQNSRRGNQLDSRPILTPRILGDESVSFT